MPRLTTAIPAPPGFEIIGRLGRGGMSEVFEAVRVGEGGFRKAVALKQLTTDLGGDRENLRRFMQEARISAQLEHPNIVRVFDFLVADERRYIVMELLRGCDLVALESLARKSGPVPWALAFTIAEQALAGLDYAHRLAGPDGRSLGLIHRDLTPRNVFVCSNGTVKVLDFGIAKLTRGQPGSAITRRGLVGTIEFMSPEQLGGKEVDARSDLYQLGASLYFLLSGRFPHGTGAPAEVIGRALAEDPTPLEELRPDLPRGVVEVIAQAMAHKPWSRFTDAANMRAAVREHLAAVPADAPPPTEMLAQLATDAALVDPDDGDELGPLAPVTPGMMATPPPIASGTAPSLPAPEPRPTTATTASARPPPPRHRAALTALGLGAVAAAGAFALGRSSLSSAPAARPTAAPTAGLPGATDPAATAPVTWRRLTYRNGAVYAARFAPSGGAVVHSASWNAGPAETVLATPGHPEVRALTTVPSVVLDVSPAGDMALLLEPAHSFVFVQRGTLARATLAGGAPRALAEQVQWAEFTPDGKQLAVVRWDGDRSRLELPMGTTLLDVPVGWIGEPRVSPDGARIAFVQHPALYDDKGWIAVVDRAGKVTKLTEEWLSAQGVAWSPDGTEIRFTATQTGTARELRAVAAAGGGERVIAQVPVGLKLEDVAADGRVLLRRELLELKVSGRGAGPDDRERDLSWFDSSYVIDMSADGRTLLLGEGGGDLIAADYSVLLRPTAGGDAVRLGAGNPHALSPDGRWALAVSKGRDRLTLLPTGAGEARELPVAGLGELGTAAFFPDSEHVLFSAYQDGVERVHVADIHGGPTRALAVSGLRMMIGNPIAPDGQHVVLVDARSDLLQLVPIRGDAPPRLVPGVEAGEDCGRWDGDGRHLFVSRFQTLPMRIFRVDTRTGARKLWRELSPPDPAGVYGVTFWVQDPAGKAYAYSYARNLSTLFLVEGLR